MDEGPRESILLPAEWVLVARDAFNGTILWKREIPLWNTHLWPLKSGPAQLPHRLVAIEDRVFVTLGIDAPVTALDAATGETILTYEGSEDTEEIIASNGELILLINKTGTKWNDYRPTDTFVWANMTLANHDFAWDGKDRAIRVMQDTTGDLLWETSQPVVPLSLSADSKGVYFHDGEKIVCRDRKNGEERWKSQPVETRSPVQTSFGPRLVLYKDVVLFSTGKYSMSAYSAETGETLWTAEQARSGHQSPEDLLVVDDLVWLRMWISTGFIKDAIRARQQAATFFLPGQVSNSLTFVTRSGTSTIGFVAAACTASCLPTDWSMLLLIPAPVISRPN
jgi:outer membrane protein assembly factor BamB